MIINGTNNHQMMSKDKEKKLNISNYSHISDIAIKFPDNFIGKLYYPDWNNAPNPEKSVMSFKGTHLLSKGGIFCLCAKAGVGKSSIMEAFISNYLNPNCDSFGVEINLSESRNKILFIDTERTNWEVHKAWSKIMKRAKINKGSKVKEKLIYVGLKKLTAEEKKEYVNQVLAENKDIGLIVYDGASDFVRNTNSEMETTDFIDWLKTFDDEISFAFTIHTNPNDNKARGWLGSELLRRCEAMLLARIIGEINEITAEFDNGKVRHGSKQSQSYKWCEIEEMFISCANEKPKIKSIKKENNNLELLNKIFQGHKSLYWADIIDGLIRERGGNKPANEKYWNRNLRNILCVEVGQNGWEIKKTFEDNIEDNIEDN